MNVEKPCSPGHCLGMLNNNMRTDILRSVHQHIEQRREQKDQRTPLEIVIESIQHVLNLFEKTNRFECVERNPFNTDINFVRFDRKSDYQHDIKLLRYQLNSLLELLKGIDKDYFETRSAMMSVK